MTPAELTSIMWLNVLGGSQSPQVSWWSDVGAVLHYVGDQNIGCLLQNDDLTTARGVL